MNPKVSIITSTRNRPELLRRCILNIQAQDFTEYEHIIVSDHCDKAKLVFDEFSEDKRIRYFENEGEHVKNVGAIAKNKGIQESSSNLICYCDDDNILLPNHISSLYESINNTNSDLVYSCGWHIFVDNLNSIINRPTYEDSLPSVPKEFLNEKILTDKFYFLVDNIHRIINYDMLCCIHKKQLLQDIGGWKFGEAVGYSEDRYLMNLMNNESVKTQFINDITCCYYARLN